jgi:hypothetical protein
VKNPNAIVGTVAAGPLAQGVLEVSSWFHWTISTGLAIYISAALTFTALLIGRAGALVGRNGLRGCWRRLMDGTTPQPDK